MVSLLDKHFTAPRINLESLARRIGATLTETREIAKRYGYVAEGYKHATKPKQGHLITSYTPGVPLHRQFFVWLQAKCDRDNLRLMIIPTSPISRSDDWIDAEAQQYLSWDKTTLEFSLIAGHMQFNPQIVRPSAGMASFGDGRSLVLASPRQIMKQLPTLVGYAPATQILTTGSCNDWGQFSPKTLQQIKAHHHFRCGFVVVGADGQQMRQVHATQEGRFTDLGVDELGHFSPAKGVVWGDLHAAQVDQAALSWAIDKTLQLQAPIIVGHDTFDGGTCNRHEARSANRFSLFNCVAEEVEHHNTLLQQIEAKTGAKFVLPYSNHTAFLDTWCNNSLPVSLHRADYELFYRVLAHGSQSVLYGNHIPPGGRYSLGRFSVGEHGHVGTNGSRGGIVQFANYGHRMITGHAHTPESLNGAEIVGCLCEKVQGYNKIGGSTWRHSIASVDKYSKVQHIIKEFS